MSHPGKVTCGYAALIGRPNAGKSTILNKILQHKVSITSSKPQTTQKQILGIKTCEQYQIVFVDTPGLHQGLSKHQKNTLNKYMSRSVTQALHDVDLVLFVIAGTDWNDDDEFILQQIIESKLPCMLLVNKIDRVKNKEELLPLIMEITNKYSFEEVFYISALKDANLNQLEQSIAGYLPRVDDSSCYYFASDDITDQNLKSRISEIIREKLIRQLNKEIPYDIAVEVEKLKYDYTKNNVKFLDVSAVIWVQRDGQKAIIIGKKGETLKRIGATARIDLENNLNIKVNLNLWVKVKSNWSSDDRILKDFGFDRDY